MKIFVISLKTSLDRREKVKSQLMALNVKHQFFDGISVDGYENHFDAYDEEKYLINCGRKATLGEIGCYASHLELWIKCLEINEPIMIMEDDFYIDKEFPSVLGEVEKLINEYGFIRLQSESRGKKIKAKDLGRFALYYYTKMPHSLMCYSISPDVAKVFIDSSKILTAPVDVMIKKIWEHKIPTFGLVPYMVRDHEEGFITTIAGRRKAKKSIWVMMLRLYTKFLWIIKRVEHNFYQTKELKRRGLIN